jgi:putative transposase
VYIDLNMVRAGMVKHLREWENSGYREIHKPPSRYGIIDLLELNVLFGFADVAQFQETHRQWIDQALTRKVVRENRWSEAIAVGSLAFVENVRSELGSKRCSATLNTLTEPILCGSKARFTTPI